MIIVYEDHAFEQMERRKISPRLVEETITKPNEIIGEEYEIKVAHKLIENKLLRVFYIIEGNIYIVKTAYKTEPRRYVQDENLL